MPVAGILYPEALSPEPVRDAPIMARVLLILPTTTYRATDLLAAAASLGVEVTVASDLQQALETQTEGATLTLDFDDPEAAIARARGEHARRPFAAVIGADDETTLIAAQIAAGLALPHNPVEAVRRCGDKLRFREIQRVHGLPHPAFHPVDPEGAVDEELAAVGFPCVLKPTFLSASRGVIRADDLEAAATALGRLAAILRRPDARRRAARRPVRALVEEYLPGAEVSLEGIVRGGRLAPLVLFDKPDPLVGPFFEETIFVTPSRHSTSLQREVIAAVEATVTAVGLQEGPVHAEVRLTPSGPVILELAPRAIGGLCPRALRFGTGMSLEELLLRHALGESVEQWQRAPGATGVMMIPVPGRGRLVSVEGLEHARRETGIREVSLTIHRGDEVLPLPEGHRYVGFIFAAAETSEQAEGALRRAHAHLRFELEPL